MIGLNWLNEFNTDLSEFEKEYDLTDLSMEDDKYSEASYWNRIATLSVFRRNMDENGYRFLYEIQALSSQIHFGVKGALLFDKLRSKEKGRRIDC